MYSAGRDFVEVCACGQAIRRVGDEFWFVEWPEELWDLYLEKFQIRHEGDLRGAEE